MARKAKTPEGEPATVKISKRQLARHQGRTVASVEQEDDGVVVWRKRTRGGKYDRHFYPWDRVITYSAGEGGRRSMAHAVVLETVILFEVHGEVIREDGNILVTDAEGNVTCVRPSSDTSISMDVVYEADRPARAEEDAELDSPPARGKAPRKTSRAAAEPDTEEFDDSDPDADTDWAGDGSDPEDLLDPGFDAEDTPDPEPRRRTRAVAEPEPPRKRRGQEPPALVRPTGRVALRTKPQAPVVKPATRKRASNDDWAD